MSDSVTKSHPIHLSTEDFDQQLASAGGKPVLVDFYAEWCGPCKLAAPIMDKFATEYEGKAMIAKLDVDEENDMAMKYGVQSIPTVIIFKNGKEIDRKIGFPGEPGYRKMLDQAIAA